MKSATSTLFLASGLVLAVACAGRTPLDDEAASSGGETGGSWGGGGVLSGGSPGYGGTPNYGGSVGYGGAAGSGGGYGGVITDGGHPGGGGTVSSGGRAGSGGSLSGGSGGYAGGQGGTPFGGSGGRAGSGGNPSGGSGGSYRSGGSGGSGGSAGNGGSRPTGGTGGGGAGGTCASVTPCGGDVVGTWNVISSCLNVSGTLDMSSIGLGCSAGTVTGALQVTGTWIARSDGTYVDKTTTTGKEQITLPASCLFISGTTTTCSTIGSVLTVLGYENSSCADAAGGGCTCWATVNQTGWPAVPSLYATTSGKYKTSATVLSLDGEANYAYCSSGARMTWTPQPSQPGAPQPVTGTIIFENSGTPATGGTAGRGGAGGGGGIVSTGGTAGTGGCLGLAPNEELIDDLNDGDRYIPSIKGRVGAWKANHDGSPNAKMYPDGDFVPTQTGDACRKYAAYVYGGGYVDWGSDFLFGLGAPYDASKYTGITFWAKVDPGTLSVVRVTFPDKDTDPAGNLCSDTSTAGTNACYNHYGKRLTLSSTWMKYTVSFSDLTQGSWGRQAPFDPATIYEVQFQIQAGSNFGIWVDDVAFTY
jgi:hypothetical protein